MKIKTAPNSEEGMVQTFAQIRELANLSATQKEQLVHILKDAVRLQECIAMACKKDRLQMPAMWIAGGAIRDVLLMKEPRIKDIDIYFMPPHEWYEDFANNKMPATLERLLQEQAQKDQGQMVSHKQTMKQEETDSYLSHAILDIIKINSPAQRYDIELIVTPNEPDTYVFESFDFSICKCALRLPPLRGSLAWDVSAWTGLVLEHIRAEKLSQEKKEAQKWDNMIEKDALWCVGKNFWQHVAQKQIVFEGFSYKANQVMYSLRTHLPRIWDKYPQYQLDVDPRCKERWEKWGEEGEAVQKLYTSMLEQKALSDLLAEQAKIHNTDSGTGSVKPRVRVL